MQAHLLLLAVLLSPSSAHAFGSKPVTKPAPAPAEKCPQPGAAQAVDLANPVDQKFLDKMKQLRVSTVARYYDHPNETIKGKTLLPAEAALLARNGFSVLTVFQHNNNAISSFTKARGTSDAQRSLVLASQNGQPRGSAIYFGVDGGWSSAKDIASVKAYFASANAVLRPAGYAVGVYGSGLVCTELRKEGLADHCWLAAATAWPGYSAYLASRQWVMVQSLPQNCGGKNVDFNQVNAEAGDFGQWGR